METERQYCLKLVYQAYLIKHINDTTQTFGNLFIFNGTEILNIWKALSGGWGFGTITPDIYKVGKPTFLEDIEKNKSYKKEGRPWWISLTSVSKNIQRSGFGIHADGFVAGTNGCICPLKADIHVFNFLLAYYNSGLRYLEVL